MTNYGEKRPATGVNKSRVKGKESHITYLLEGKTVKTAFWDPTTQTVVKETILNLELDQGEVVEDMFVFTEFVAVKIQSTWRFFPYPLIAMNYVRSVDFYTEEGDD